MRIAIITQPLCTNYGGILQNYALQELLRRRGHEVVTIQKELFLHVKYPLFLYVLLIRIFQRITGKRTAPVFYEYIFNRDLPKVTKYTLGFVKKYINTRIVKSIGADINPKDYDAFIVGSDQVWRKEYNNLDETFLIFTKDCDVKRIAYAASFGIDEWNYDAEQTAKYGKALKYFDGVSVREAHAVEMCKKYMGVNAIHVLDPTMLLDKEDYERLCDNKTTISNYVFCHFLDSSDAKNSFVNSICKKTGWKGYSLNHKGDEHDLCCKVEDRIQPPIEDWLMAIKHARLVMTDSFHATVFSIIFEKPFYVIGNKKRGDSRFVSLLTSLGLQDRLIDINNIKSNVSNFDVSYNEANILKSALQKMSLDYLHRFF
jgi:hypothetical protein